MTMDNCETKKYILNDSITKNIKTNKGLLQIPFNGGLVELTAKEADIWRLLSHNPETVFSREALLEKVWGYDYYGDSRAVDIQIRRLRKKIEIDPSNPKCILTKWGEGYFYKNII
jgi:two-component system, OmpR family, response regulator VicR